METDLGKVAKEVDGFKVRFERTLHYNIQTVWDAITNPDKLKMWFTDFEMDFKPGGKLTIFFRDEARTATYGEIVAIEAPHKFVFTWEGELAVWELFAEGNNKCKVILTYSKLSPEFAINAPAGFHTLLDRLEDMLNGSTVFHPFGTEENDPDLLRMQERYEKDILKEYPELERFKPIVIERTYNAPAQKVWEAITNKEQMKEWYFDLAEFKPVVGFEFQFYGQGHKGEEYLHLCRVTEVVTGKKLTYSWRYKGVEGTSFVSFELMDEGPKTTRVRLTHKGLNTFATDNPDFARESFNAGWTELMGTHLKQFVEK